MPKRPQGLLWKRVEHASSYGHCETVLYRQPLFCGERSAGRRLGDSNTACRTGLLYSVLVQSWNLIQK
jgi:hypothetical protein